MYDNDCKYCLFKGNLIKAEDKKETHDGEQDDGEKTDDVEKMDDDAKQTDAGNVEKTDDDMEKTENNASSHPVENTPSPRVIPPVDHHLYGVYWLNDSSVGLVVSDRFDAAKTRVLAVNIHGGVDTLSLPFPPASCVFQQVRTTSPSFPVGSGWTARDHAPRGGVGATEPLPRADDSLPPVALGALLHLRGVLRARLHGVRARQRGCRGGVQADPRGSPRGGVVRNPQGMAVCVGSSRSTASGTTSTRTTPRSSPR